MLFRERRPWTLKEDQLLRNAAEQEDPDQPYPSRWSAIAEHIPGRTNKDCRKRWCVKMAQDIVKGSWSPDEDQRLLEGVAHHGPRWSLIASVVQTRNSDQCSKRWTDTLNPAIDRTTWSTEADERLLEAVSKHGKLWSKIVKTYFPGRTGLSAKNRYNSLTQLNKGRSRNTRPGAGKPDRPPYFARCKSDSSSTPPPPWVVPTPSPFFESSASRSPSPSPEMENNTAAFRLQNVADTKANGVVRHNPPISPDLSYQPFVVSNDEIISVFAKDRVGSLCSATPFDNKDFLGLNLGHGSGIHLDIPSIGLYPAHPQCPNITTDDVANRPTSFDILSTSQTGLFWEPNVPVSYVNRYKDNWASR